MNRCISSAVSFAALALIAVGVAHAQDEEAGEKVNMVIVYGDDACPTPQGGEITVCARKAENERYRIPETLRSSDDPENTAWTQRVESYELVGAFGTLSCDPAGAGGFTGCTQQLINAAYADRAEGSDVRFSQLIEAARAERLSTIDADAAAEQARVEQIEREYIERLERERNEALPGEVDLNPPQIGPSAEDDDNGGETAETDAKQPPE